MVVTIIGGNACIAVIEPLLPLIVEKPPYNLGTFTTGLVPIILKTKARSVADSFCWTDVPRNKCKLCVVVDGDRVHWT